MSSLNNSTYEDAIQWIYDVLGFDLVSVGLAELPTSPLKWVHSVGSMRNQIERITLAPGRGIGGIVVSAGKPMLFTDIDLQLDQREFASYPIVFAEELRGFCALPLRRGSLVVGVLFCAFRNVAQAHVLSYLGLLGAVADGFCSLEVITDDIAEALGRNAEEDRFVRPNIEDILDLSSEPTPQVFPDPYKVLSPKELEVFLLLARGYTNKEIAHILAMSVKTAETHRSKIYRKLGLESRAQLVSCAIRYQILGI